MAELVNMIAKKEVIGTRKIGSQKCQCVRKREAKGKEKGWKNQQLACYEERSDS